MKNFLKNEKLWCVVAGAAAVIVGKKYLLHQRLAALQ